MKAYQIYKTFESYHEEGIEIVEIPTRFIYTDKNLAEKVLDTKQFCSDVTIMCDNYILKELTLIESEENLIDNYIDIYTPLERIVLKESEDKE